MLKTQLTVTMLTRVDKVDSSVMHHVHVTQSMLVLVKQINNYNVYSMAFVHLFHKLCVKCTKQEKEI